MPEIKYVYDMPRISLLYGSQLAIMLCILAVAFFLQYRRNRSRTTLMWFAGWVLVTLRVLLMYPPRFLEMSTWSGWQLAADVCMVLAALLFMGSFSDADFRIGRFRGSYFTAMSVVVLGYTLLQGIWHEVTTLHTIAFLALAVMADIVALLWAVQPKYLPPRLALTVVLPAIAISSGFISLGYYRQNIYVLQSAANLCTILFLLFRYRRASWSVVLTCGSFLLWAAMPWFLFFGSAWPVLSMFYIDSIAPIKLSAALGMLLLLLDQEVTSSIRAKERERRIRQELELYSQLDVNLFPGRDLSSLARNLCQQITEASRFRQALIFLRDVEHNFYVAGEAGVPPATVTMLGDLGRRLTPQRLKDFQREAHAERIATNSYWADLKPFVTSSDAMDIMPLSKTVVIPLYTQAKLVSGFLLLTQQKDADEPLFADDLLPLESLASKFSTAMENASLMQRLVRSEKLAGLGQVAGGVAHELNNPLTVVMGYAELIADSAQEDRVRTNAGIIHAEALRMKQIIESLVRFWRPAPHAYQQVDVAQMLQDVYRLRAPELERRSIDLELSMAKHLPAVSANADRLKQVILQLISNAVEAVERSSHVGARQRIRMDASYHNDKLHILISDTGPGFPDPNRVFDPFFTTKQPGEGAGLGLSICYGIVREHRGEINAFNMHPNGAAVVIELPVRDAVLDAAMDSTENLVGH
ncbi:MAG: sensor histidine kinase [Acidobacteriaceae bacterium]